MSAAGHSLLNSSTYFKLTQDIGKLLQDVGAEYGTTTGRKRRCGWLDVVVLKYSHMLNDYTSLNLTKLDVLDTLDEIKIGVNYIVDGVCLDSFPGIRNLTKPTSHCSATLQ